WVFPQALRAEPLRRLFARRVIAGLARESFGPPRSFGQAGPSPFHRAFAWIGWPAPAFAAVPDVPFPSAPSPVALWIDCWLAAVACLSRLAFAAGPSVLCSAPDLSFGPGFAAAVGPSVAGLDPFCRLCFSAVAAAV